MGQFDDGLELAEKCKKLIYWNLSFNKSKNLANKKFFFWWIASADN